MLGRGFGSGNQCQNVRPCETSRHHKIGQQRAPFGQGAGLVERDDTDRRQALQGFTVAKQYAKLCRPPGADHDRRWRGQSHGAGASDDEHRNRRSDGKRQCWIGPDREPGGEGNQGHEHHRRHENRGDLVRQPLNWRARHASARHHVDDLRQHRIGTDLGRAHGQSAVLVDRAAGQAIARSLFHRQ